MVVDVLCACIAAAAAVLSAKATATASKQTRRAEERAARRAKESRLAMELMYATCSLSLVCAKKLDGIHTNGDVKKAMEEAAAAQQAYMDFCQEQAAHNFAKI